MLWVQPLNLSRLRSLRVASKVCTVLDILHLEVPLINSGLQRRWEAFCGYNLRAAEGGYFCVAGDSWEIGKCSEVEVSFTGIDMATPVRQNGLFRYTVQIKNNPLTSPSFLCWNKFFGRPKSTIIGLGGLPF